MDAVPSIPWQIPSPWSLAAPWAMLQHRLAPRKEKPPGAGSGVQGQHERPFWMRLVGSAVMCIYFSDASRFAPCAGMHQHGWVAGPPVLPGLGGLSLPEYFRPFFSFLNVH